MTAADAAPTDAAWVTIDVPLQPQQLAQFCLDIERLYRINPYLEFRAWRPGAGGIDAAFRNLSNGRDYDLHITLDRRSQYEFTVHYDRGIKRQTLFRIEPAAGGSRLGVTDDYSGAAPGSSLGDVDRSLHAWGAALKEYLQREARWGRFRLWRWYMRRVWMPMKPSARRITFIILVVTAAEIALFGLVMAIYWAEHLR